MANIEVTIDTVRVSSANHNAVVILKETMSDRYLPVWIGLAEADAITTRLQGVLPFRPLTHDFTCSVIDALGGSLDSVVISGLENNTFYARVTIAASEGQKEIDCRPSDAMAMAVRKGIPILVDEQVLNEAGIVIE